METTDRDASGPRWVDTHCHLFLASASTEELMRRASEAGVDWVMVPGTHVAGSRDARNVAASLPGRALWSAGLHPHDAAQWPEQQARISSLAAEASAVGECGLDYYRNLSPPEDQRSAFHDQLRLAQSLDKPVIVHCRDAFSDVFDAIEAIGAGLSTVMHCWTGGPKWTRRFLDLGVTFSFAGPVTYPTGDTVRRGAVLVPPERALVETDTPYLTPPPDRSAANEPANVVRVGEALANVWTVPVAEVASVTTSNAERIFGRPS